jgi:hypothetical protein
VKGELYLQKMTKKIELSPVAYTLCFSTYFLIVFNLPFWFAIKQAIVDSPEQNPLFLATVPLT